MKKQILLNWILKYIVMKFLFNVVGHKHRLPVGKGKFCKWFLNIYPLGVPISQAIAGGTALVDNTSFS